MSGTIAVIGEAVGDAIVEADPVAGLRLRVLPGGGPVNTAVALSRLGTPTKYLGRLASGTIGNLLRSHLVDSRVDLSAAVEAAEPASLAIATITPEGHASYDFYVEGTADWQWTEDELAAWNQANTSAIHAGSLALAQQPGAALIERLLEQARTRVTVCIDPNVRLSLVPASFYREAMPRWASIADIIRLSNDDLATVMPGVGVAEACSRWHAAGASLVVVTLGGNGVYASLRGEAVTVETPPITPVDTVGAGDTFTAGMLHTLNRANALGGRLSDLSTADLRTALLFGVGAAAVVCQRAGADPPWADELDLVRAL
ncbi:MAG TPA: carbohydrate kinase [Micromonosporaceae bacterium]|nr:carbohydrate kinase [Micromonosporaceae bacterium]